MTMNSLDSFRRNLRLAVKDSTEKVAEYARENHRFTSRSGNLERAVDTRFSNHGLVGTVFLNKNRAPYGPFVHAGTKPHTITPKNRRALRWVSGNRFIFAKQVNHPGTREDPFLYEALDNQREVISKIFENYTGRAVNEVAKTIEGNQAKVPNLFIKL